MQIAGKHINPVIFVLHCLFWLSWIIGFTVIQSLGKGMHECFVWLMYYLITLPVFIAHTYLIAYWLVPHYFLKRRYILFGSWLMLFLVVFSVVELIVSNEFVFRIFDPSKCFARGYLNTGNILISGLGNHYIILVFLAFKAVKSWHEAKNRKEELETQNLETELEIFRYQLQPQLILSIIIELEQLSEVKSVKVPEMIVRISDFINQLLAETKAELIQLEKEINLIREFLSIQELAFGRRVKTNLAINGKIAGRVVPPLLIIPLLNKAFQIINKCGYEFECNVIIKVEKKYILFSFSLWSENDFKLTTHKTKGLIKKRLMYNYQNKYRIIENEDVNFHEVSIEILN